MCAHVDVGAFVCARVCVYVCVCVCMNVCVCVEGCCICNRRDDN